MFRRFGKRVARGLSLHPIDYQSTVLLRIRRFVPDTSAVSWSARENLKPEVRGPGRHCTHWLAGTVTVGAAPFIPVSEIENRSITNPKVYLDWMSVPAIQNQRPLYSTAT